MCSFHRKTKKSSEKEVNNKISCSDSTFAPFVVSTSFYSKMSLVIRLFVKFLNSVVMM